MRTPFSYPSNYLTIQTEPQQLDLFDWLRHTESPSQKGYFFSPAVCDHIATVARTCHGLGTEHHSALSSFISGQCSFSGAWSHWHDYVQGVASAMSFFPTPSEETFVRSDRAAMASDWASVQLDLDQVWRAITSAERHCNDRSQRNALIVALGGLGLAAIVGIFGNMWAAIAIAVVSIGGPTAAIWLARNVRKPAAPLSPTSNLPVPSPPSAPPQPNSSGSPS